MSPEQPADHSRSGDDVVAAVERASAGTPHGGVQTDPVDAKPHAAPVKQVAGDTDMTRGQVVTGPGTGPPAVPAAPDAGSVGGTGAQSVRGTRESDQVAGE